MMPKKVNAGGYGGMRARLLYATPAQVLVLAAATPVFLTCGQHAVAEAATVSAIGNEAPITLAVSPLYAHTGMVAAVSVPVGGCSGTCIHLWITRDRGATWHRSDTSPPGSGILVVAGGHGGERLVAAGPQGVVASNDDGTTWHIVGPAGTPAAAPPLGGGTVLVAGQGAGDYLLDGDTRQAVPGSGGAVVDVAFAPVQDSSGRNATALLAARDRASGLPVVLRCDVALSCSGATPLPGVTPSSGGDMSLLLAPDFAAGGPAYVRTASELYRSDDGGRTFLALALPPHPGAHIMTIPGAALGGAAPHGIDLALLDILDRGAAQTTGGGVFTSTDRGVTWHTVGSPGVLDDGATAIAAAPDGRLFAGYVNGHGAAGLVCSDGGTAWQATCGAATTCPGGGCTGARVSGTPPAVGPPIAANVGSNTGADARSPELANGTPALTGGQPPVASGTVRVPPLIAGALGMLLASLAVSTRRRRRRRPQS